MTSALTRRGVCVRRRMFPFLMCTFVLFVSARLAPAEDIRVFSGGAPQNVLRSITPEFEKATGHKVNFTFALVTIIQQKLTAGEKADLILLPVPLIASTEKTLPLRSEGRGVLARVGLAVITPESAPQAGISTSDAIRQMLLDAKTVAVPEPSTPSGAHLVRMIEQLGITDAVRPKLQIKAAIDGGPDLVAKGEADVGFYLMSEVQASKGVKIAGLLPAPLQSFVVYGTAIPAGNATPEPALAFIKFISEADRRAVWQSGGFELVPRP
jgi:molybdate transport system substrate-binding protein